MRGRFAVLGTVAALIAAALAAGSLPLMATRAEAPKKEAATGTPSQPWFPKAPPLPAPTGEVIRAGTTAQLYQAAADVRPGGTILLAPGRYVLPRKVALRADRVTLRGEDDRNRVVLDGEGTLGEGIGITACSGVTIADLTLQNVRWNGIKIDSETGVQNLRIYNCVLHNVWQRAIKGVKVPPENREKLRPRGVRIEYCLLYNDRPKQFSDDASDTDANFHGDYIGGIDVMCPGGWTISDNVFVGIQGRTRQARGAVFLWQDAHDVTVERNIVIDCDSGICLGNSSKDADMPVHCTGCIVRNNLITRAPENGLLADYTKDCAIVHNTVYDPQTKLGRGVRIVHENGGLLVANNLLSGPKILKEKESKVRLEGNVEGASPTIFADPAHGNLRLAQHAAGVVDAAARLKEAPEDLDRRPRGARVDAGAHELSAD